ncbi:protein ORF17 [Cyprinid herpesvirus 2]|uniref:Protein ORF17 n=1 Tax=Cyprinid herpesvirus 2 TaxID=317878 RepID=K7PBN5_CYHV2|nr:protein ORF17 [Cyprinid herpesvirus 2]AFJ20471.1 protein ORF17 [Cyprinid herpesvirus 2]
MEPNWMSEFGDGLSDYVLEQLKCDDLSNQPSFVDDLLGDSLDLVNQWINDDAHSALVGTVNATIDAPLECTVDVPLECTVDVPVNSALECTVDLVGTVDDSQVVVDDRVSAQCTYTDLDSQQQQQQPDAEPAQQTKRQSDTDASVTDEEAVERTTVKKRRPYVRGRFKTAQDFEHQDTNKATYVNSILSDIKSSELYKQLQDQGEKKRKIKSNFLSNSNERFIEPPVPKMAKKANGSNPQKVYIISSGPTSKCPSKQTPLKRNYRRDPPPQQPPESSPATSEAGWYAPPEQTSSGLDTPLTQILQDLFHESSSPEPSTSPEHPVSTDGRKNRTTSAKLMSVQQIRESMNAVQDDIEFHRASHQEPLTDLESIQNHHHQGNGGGCSLVLPVYMQPNLPFLPFAGQPVMVMPFPYGKLKDIVMRENNIVSGCQPKINYRTLTARAWCGGYRACPNLLPEKHYEFITGDGVLTQPESTNSVIFVLTVKDQSPGQLEPSCVRTLSQELRKMETRHHAYKLIQVDYWPKKLKMDGSLADVYHLALHLSCSTGAEWSADNCVLRCLELDSVDFKLKSGVVTYIYAEPPRTVCTNTYQTYTCATAL